MARQTEGWDINGRKTIRLPQGMSGTNGKRCETTVKKRKRKKRSYDGEVEKTAHSQGGKEGRLGDWGDLPKATNVKALATR